MPPELHEDFGEKIGGAKKDLWKDRGLYTDDLDGMNEREAEKYVKKDNVWKKPDYQAIRLRCPGVSALLKDTQGNTRYVITLKRKSVLIHPAGPYISKQIRRTL